MPQVYSDVDPAACRVDRHRRRDPGGFVAKLPVSRPPLAGPDTTCTTIPTMKRFLLLLPAALLAACGSAPSSDSASSGSAPMIYVSSARPAYAIASCLDNRLSDTERSQHNGVTDITVGSRSYFVTLTPSANGSVIKVVRGSGSEPAEEAMRFAIARCAI
jgi:hypothetical protein